MYSVNSVQLVCMVQTTRENWSVRYVQCKLSSISLFLENPEYCEFLAISFNLF